MVYINEKLAGYDWQILNEAKCLESIAANLVENIPVASLQMGTKWRP
jgi:hypothetical protein